MKTILILFFTALSMAALAQDTTVVQLEYFFDSDYGIGNNTVLNVTPAADGTFPFTASIKNLSVGNHKLYIRTKDSNGKWSFTARRNVEVFTPDAKVNIVSGEYFIDADPGFGSGFPIAISSPDSAISLLNFPAATSSLSVGYHKLYGRLKDNLGRWSQTFRRNIEVYKNDTNYITKVEYFFKEDKGFGNCDSVVFASPSVDGTFTFNIPLSSIPAGADTLFIRAGDSSENKWSLTAPKKISDSIILPLTLLNFTVEKQGATAQLNWQTANEVNTYYFDIQRSTDGIHFTSVGKVTAKGNSSAKNNYSFADDVSTAAKGKLYYRLTMVDKDGSFSYSRIAFITIDAGEIKITVIPNPAHDYFIVSNYQNIAANKAKIIVRDLQGRTLLTQDFTNGTGQKINVSALSKGMYFVSIVTQNKIQTTKLLIE